MKSHQINKNVAVFDKYQYSHHESFKEEILADGGLRYLKFILKSLNK